MSENGVRHCNEAPPWVAVASALWPPSAPEAHAFCTEEEDEEEEVEKAEKLSVFIVEVVVAR